MLSDKMSSLAVSSKSRLPDCAVSGKCLCVSALNAQLMLNAAGCCCQPSDVCVPETVPLDFVEINDSSEICSQRVGKRDDCSVSSAPIACSVTIVGHDSHIAEELSSKTTHVQSNVVMSSPEKDGPGSPIFNHHRQFAIPVPVSSSPSLFDEEEEKRLHQRNTNKNLLSASKKNVATTIPVCIGVSQPSPSVLSRKLDLNVTSYHQNEKNMYQVNADYQPPTLPPLLLSTVNERGSLQAVNEVKCSDSCGGNENIKLNGVQSSNKIFPNELAIQMNGADDRPCCMHTPDVHSAHAKDVPVACAVSATRTICQDLLATAVNESQQDIASATFSSTGVASDFLQPLPKKRRRESVNSSSPHTRSTENSTHENGTFFHA